MTISKIKNLFSGVLLAILIFSCSEKSEERIISNMMIGNWAIDNMTFHDIKLFNPMSNILSLKKDNKIQLSGIENGKWNIEKRNKGEFLFYLKSLEPKFSDTLRIDFYGDNRNKLLKMKLTSKQMEITCSKLLLNYDLEKKNITKIIELTEK